MMSLVTFGGNRKKSILNVVLALTLIFSAFALSSANAYEAKAANGEVVIAEVYNAANQTQEWVTLANISDNPVNLQGWGLRDYSANSNPQGVWEFPNVTIAPNSLLVIERSANASGAQAQGVDTLVGGLFDFSGTSDRLDLLDADGALIDGVAWGANNSVEGFSITVPQSGFSSGTSLERISRVDSDSASDWAYIPDPEAGRWAPLAATSSPVVLSRTPANDAVLTTTAPEVGAVFTYGQGNTPGTASLTLRDDVGEIVTITDAASLGNGEYGIEIDYSTEELENGLTPGAAYEVELQVSSSGGTASSVWSFRIFQLGQAGGVVISEIYIDALDETNSEFVELYNPTGSPINLSGYTFGSISQAGNENRQGVIPDNTFIAPFSYYLIGDADVLADGLNSWASPDLVVQLSIANSHGAYWIKDASGAFVDRVSWGSNVHGEGTPFPSNPPVRASLERLANDGSSPLPGEAGELRGNGWDTDNNATDFVIRMLPEPQNSSSTPEQ